MTDEELDALMKSYNQEDKFREYLVDSAILRCNQATTDDFPFSEEETVVLVNKNEECCNITLNVSENPISLNKLKYATVKDTLMNVNIIPPKCNCRLAIDRNAERRRIGKDTKRNENGVCMHLMRLNEEWDNLEIDGKSYLKKINIEPSMFSAGVGRIIGGLDTAVEEEIDGITMTSVLFCKHGGLITPITSGQTVTTKGRAIDILQEYLATGEFEEDEVEEALAYLAGLSNYKLMEYKYKYNNDDYDFNRYDIYILGWTEYYYEKFAMNIDPNYIKAQCYKESTMGYMKKDIPAYNTERDIMQALDVRNGNIYEYIDISIDNFKILTSYNAYITGRAILIANNLKPERGASNADKKNRCGGIINTLFNTKIDGSGTCYYEGSKEFYYYQLETVTPIMSIGLGLDKMQDLLKIHSGSYYEALKEYNNSKTQEEYANTIIKWAETKGDSLTME